MIKKIIKNYFRSADNLTNYLRTSADSIFFKNFLQILFNNYHNFFKIIKFLAFNKYFFLLRNDYF
jgi:hypothetical protein